MATSRNSRNNVSTLSRRPRTKFPNSSGEGESSCNETANEQELVSLMAAVHAERTNASVSSSNTEQSPVPLAIMSHHLPSFFNCQCLSHVTITSFIYDKLCKPMMDIRDQCVLLVPMPVRHIVFTKWCTLHIKPVHFLIVLSVPVIIFLMLVFYGHWLFCSVNWGMCFPVPMLLFPSFYDLSDLHEISESAVIAKSMSDDTRRFNVWSDRPISEAKQSVHLQCQTIRTALMKQSDGRSMKSSLLQSKVSVGEQDEGRIHEKIMDDTNEKSKMGNNNNNNKRMKTHLDLSERTATMTVFLVSGLHMEMLQSVLLKQSIFESISLVSDFTQLQTCFLQSSLRVWDDHSPSMKTDHIVDTRSVQRQSRMINNPNNDVGGSKNDDDNNDVHRHCAPLKDHYSRMNVVNLGTKSGMNIKLNTAILIDIDSAIGPLTLRAGDFLRFAQNLYCEDVTVVQIMSHHLRLNQALQRQIQEYFYIQIRQPFAYFWIDDSALFRPRSSNDNNHDNRNDGDIMNPDPRVSDRFRAVRHSQIERLKAFLV